MKQMRIVEHPAARKDIIDYTSYLSIYATEKIARKFLDCVIASYQDLLGNPHIGSLVQTQHPDLHDIRKWPVADFPNILIFYRTGLDTITIIRVMHGRRDWVSFLGEIST